MLGVHMHREHVHAMAQCHRAERLHYRVHAAEVVDRPVLIGLPVLLPVLLALGDRPDILAHPQPREVHRDHLRITLTYLVTAHVDLRRHWGRLTVEPTAT